MQQDTAVLARGVGPKEPELTEQLVAYAASTVAHLAGPPTWWQFDEFTRVAIKRWNDSSRFERRKNQQIIEKWAADWVWVSQNPYGRHLEATHRRLSRDRNGNLVGPVVWALHQDIQDRLNFVITSGAFKLNRQAAWALLEAASVTLQVVHNGVFPKRPPAATNLLEATEAVAQFWLEIERQGAAPDALDAPRWWYLNWSGHRVIDDGFIAAHPSLVLMCNGDDKFRTAWPAAVERMENERRRQIAEARRRREAEQAQSGYGHASLRPGAAIRPTYAGSRGSGVVIASEYDLFPPLPGAEPWWIIPNKH
ncbi:hypothetical protein GCM10017608_16110 [Agromyces luteolus]|uniref:Uncharacterized protein n=1 Tax=Agromyces luteolus TaxID=88373 RepID=A0A7C9LXK3_9MICO|nr:hypothetical protein [Agromyces luteolus]MUN06917.1 hypothetical protein [Agromyces luteolus]GLK27677.1 hypothetical protein GCM10017608_16110 [Agromyces luteolus]